MNSTLTAIPTQQIGLRVSLGQVCQANLVITQRTEVLPNMGNRSVDRIQNPKGNVYKKHESSGMDEAMKFIASRR